MEHGRRPPRRRSRAGRVDDAFPLLREWLEADPDALAARYRRLYIPDRDGRHLQRNARSGARERTGNRDPPR